MPRPAEGVQNREQVEIAFAGVPMVLDARAAAYLPGSDALIVADLHLEKGSYFAMRGTPVPLCDSRETLRRLQELIAAFTPARVVCLGDSFHDRAARSRLCDDDRTTLARLSSSVAEWVWVSGNHDPQGTHGFTGQGTARLQLCGLTLAHQPVAGTDAQIIGHYHPKLKFWLKGHKVGGPCFVVGTNRLVMPALGAFTGGLRVTREAPWPDLVGPQWRQYLIFNDQLWPIAA